MSNLRNKLKDALDVHSSFYAIAAFMIVIGTAIVGYALGVLQDVYPTINMLAVFAICSVTFIAGSLIVALAIEEKTSKHLVHINQRLISLEKSVSRLSLGSEKDLTEVMLSQFEFLHFEKDFPGDEIWVISSSLENDDPGKGPYVPIVLHNLERGIRYRYFYPETNSVLGVKSRIASAFSDYNELLHFHSLPPDVFRLHVGKNLGVYRNISTGISDIAFVEIKFDKAVRWAKVDEQLTVDIVGWLGQHIDS